MSFGFLSLFLSSAMSLFHIPCPLILGKNGPYFFFFFSILNNNSNNNVLLFDNDSSIVDERVCHRAANLEVLGWIPEHRDKISSSERRSTQPVD